MDVQSTGYQQRQQPPVLSYTGVHFFTAEQKQQFYALCSVKESDWTEKDKNRYNELVQFSAQLDAAYWAGHANRHSVTH